MRRGHASRLAVVLGYVLAACAFTWPLPLHLGTHFTGDPGGDTGVYVWNQWVFHQELVEGRNPLTTEKILSLTARSEERRVGKEGRATGRRDTRKRRDKTRR